MKKRMMIGLILCLFSIKTFAQATWHSSTIERIYPVSDGRVVISFDSDSELCTSTSAPDYYYLGVGQNGLSEEGFKNMYALILAAVAMQKTVTINFDASTNACYINRLLVNF